VESTIFFLFNGIVYGLLLFMMSSGLTLIFSMMGVLNFAHASFYMLGAYFAYQISTIVGFWPGLVVAPVLVGCMGALIERYFLRTVHRHGHVAELLFTFGLAMLIEETVVLIWGRNPVPYSVPQDLDFALFQIGGTSYSAYKIFMMAISIAMFVSLYGIIARTRVGQIIQAALTHPETVGTLGHNVPRLFMLVFGAGTGLAGLAGVIGGNAFVTEPGMATALGTIVFVVIIVGGLGSLTGAFIASLLIGVIQTTAVAIDVSLADLFATVGLDLKNIPLHELWTKRISDVAPILPYLFMVLILVLRPRGLLGTRDS
jgi:branched-chain amino acid transport system permease protein